MASQVLSSLCIRSDGWYVDGTYGRGGHSRAILNELGPNGRLYVFDRDPQAIADAKQQWGQDARVIIHATEFARMAEQVDESSVDGVLLDVGVSSPQLDDPQRGFSFMQDGPLDMRMDNQHGPTVAEMLAEAEVGEIAQVISRFGEDRFAYKIAKAIVDSRAVAPIHRTRQLADIVANAIPRRFHESHKHPATRTFQALRIWVNRELDQLSLGLEAAFNILKPHGRLAVISFHSLEDRLVKNYMRDLASDAQQWRGLPNIPVEAQARAKLIGKAQHADATEVEHNPRSRSATLRVLERVR
jgi:16S rRNA (cytosine1402-N4)-methyltransferase